MLEGLLCHHSLDGCPSALGKWVSAPTLSLQVSPGQWFSKSGVRTSSISSAWGIVRNQISSFPPGHLNQALQVGPIICVWRALQVILILKFEHWLELDSHGQSDHPGALSGDLCWCHANWLRTLGLESWLHLALVPDNPLLDYESWYRWCCQRSLNTHTCVRAHTHRCTDQGILWLSGRVED